MTSKFKALTENTPQLSFERSTGEKEQPSEPLVSLEETLINTPIMSPRSRLTFSAAKREKITLHAMFLKAAFLHLKKVGLARSFKVLSKDGTTVEEIQIVLDPAYFTEDLDLVLSEGVVNEKV